LQEIFVFGVTIFPLCTWLSLALFIILVAIAFYSNDGLNNSVRHIVVSAFIANPKIM
jgi:hypothetical protein